MPNKNKDNDLANLRHTAAHLLAAAVMDLWPNAKRAIGPAIDDGFYYDFDFGSEKITESDLVNIEDKMRDLVKSWTNIVKVKISKPDAEIMFSDNRYKLELISEISHRGEQLTLYQSDRFIDLCRGGHIDHPDQQLKHFKLLSLAGAYWRGDEKNKMLTRIYGTVFPSKEELHNFIWQQEEAKKRDHRKLGRELDLFYFSELVGPGLPLFTPKGTIIRRELENFVQSLQEPFGYTRVQIPHLAKTALYEKSGHWTKYKENMFQVTSDDGVKFAMKPMNCPHHIELFSRKVFSYKELPQRYSEVTAVYRQEKAGELLGLSRVYMLTQDDAHIFCTEDQALQESLNVYKIIKDFYSAFEFGISLKVRLSLRDPQHPDKYLGNDATWKKSEDMMRQVARKANLEIYEGIGEAAFYAPKLDFMAYDSLGREWQLATIQLDLNFSERFDLKYINSEGKEKHPVIIHRAILGSVERFMSILIEHYAGAFPTWLSPIQAAILPVSQKSLSYAKQVEERLHDANIRTFLDESDSTVSKKILESQRQKTPYMLIVGPKEEQGLTVSVRTRNGKDHGSVPVDTIADTLKKEIDTRALEIIFK